MTEKPNPLAALLGSLFKENPLVGFGLLAAVIAAGVLFGPDVVNTFAGAGE